MMAVLLTETQEIGGKTEWERDKDNKQKDEMRVTVVQSTMRNESRSSDVESDPSIKHSALFPPQSTDCSRRLTIHTAVANTHAQYIKIKEAKKHSLILVQNNIFGGSPIYI